MKQFLSVALICCCLLTPASQALAALPESILESTPEIPPDLQRNLDKSAQISGSEGDYFKLKLAEEKLKSGDFSEALKQVGKVSEPVFSFWKNVLLAEIYLAQDKPRQALALLKDLPPRPRHEIAFGEGDYENLYKQALSTRYVANGKLAQDTKDDAAELLALFPKDDDIQKLLSDADKTAPLSTLQKITKLHALHSRYQFKDVQGLVSADEITHTKLTKEEKCLSLYELGNSLRTISGEGAGSTAAFRAILGLHCGDNQEPRALYWLGSINDGPNTDTGDTRKGYLLKLYKDYPNHRLADDAVYKLYKIAEKKQNTSDMDKYYHMLMALKKGDMKGELAFELAFPYFQKENYSKAISYFEKAIDSEPTADESYPRVMYWYARSLEKTNNAKNKNKAKIFYQELVKTCPFSFYAILAGKRIGVDVKVPPLPKLDGNTPDNGNDSLALVDDFNQKGLFEASKTILEMAMVSHPEWENTHKEFITRKLIESQNYRKALDLASQHFDSGFYGPIVRDTNDPMFAAFYPLAYQDKTKLGYKTSSLPFGAIEGIMREESLFQRSARSYVGARGLMQLMPATAAMVRRQMPEVEIANDITDPQSNILLGSSYLRDMKDYFNDQMPLAIMAYNAGPGNVNKWLKRFGNLELDEFIENIPLSETRGYVKRVMRSMQVYGSFYNEKYFENLSQLSFNIKSRSSSL